MRQLCIFGILLVFSINAFTQEKFDCFTILAGKKATENRSVFIAHNEDDSGEQIVNWYKVPGQVHRNGEKITLKNGAKLSQADTTYSYLWLQMPGMDFSDSYMNEHGVTVASNQCPSREDSADLTNGGIGYWLRRIMVERATSARQAVKIAGALVERFGYYYSGRSYCIADPNETWIMSVVKGKQWVAKRIPDSQIMIIPNYYTIKEVHPEKSKNCLASPDLIQYAKKRGWYNPEEDGAFNFRQAYASKNSLEDMGNIARKWRALELLTGKSYNRKNDFPFAVNPEDKVSRNDIAKVLEDHYEGTELDKSDHYAKGDPHKRGVMSICSNTNQYGFIGELRDDLPSEIGAVMWLAPRSPCMHAYIPWYAGIKKVPDELNTTDYMTALENHFDKPDHIQETYSGHPFVTFVNHSDRIDKNYGEKIDSVRRRKEVWQKEIYREARKEEKQAVDIWHSNQEKSMEILTEFTHRIFKKSVKRTE